MDFEVVGLDNLVSSNSATAAPSNNGSFALDSTTAENSKPKWYGSGFLKQERAINGDDFRDFKVAKTSSCGETLMKIPLQRSNTTSLSEGHQQMLSFSSPTSQTVTFPYYHPTSTGFRKHRVWLYRDKCCKHAGGGIRVQRAFHSITVDGVRASSFDLQWDGVVSIWDSPTLILSRGRCRRTDGKKWRCSRDAVADQKYCERHMNRGRHRSRKPVEGQSGHSATGLTTTNGKRPMATSSSTSVVPPGGVSNSLGLSHHHQLSNLQPGSSNHLPGIANINRSLQDKENADEGYRHTTVLSMTSPKVSLKDNQFSVPKQQNAYEESSRQEFGLVCSDSLLNPLDRSSSLVNCRNYGAHDNLNHHENKSQHALRQFMDNWPKNQSEQRTAISWPDVDLQPDRTQLSISIPMVTSDFMSSTSSPTNEKLTASPLRLSQELKMGLGVGTLASEQHQSQTNWVPISWEPSMGGPLGEVLHTTSNSTGDCKNAKPLNLMESWDNSPRLASSPTGVLQRGAFGSLSNSSAGSSPRAESSKTLDGASLCNGLIGSGLMNPSLPAL
ncbi:UNVERIFIED_CONTAM: Growth-regulating factor 6 [Sesamum angustifolium]|uniref:Growth-regulating factor n=1 Tax=Sesamum angustifolium TaxID=2727405 RepID=A0AAW2LZ10_9LAMI